MAKETETDLVARRELDAVEEALQDAGLDRYEDPQLVAREIVSRILEAETPEQVFSQGAAVHASDILGRPFTARSLRFNRSTFKEGSTVYALIDAEFLDDGSRGVVSCGSRNVMAQLYRLQELKALPANVKIVEADTPTEQGFKPMWLAQA